MGCGCLLPDLARRSALSFPGIPQWVGIHCRTTVHSWKRSCRSFSRWWVGWSGVLEVRDWRAAFESVRMTVFCGFISALHLKALISCVFIFLSSLSDLVRLRIDKSVCFTLDNSYSLSLKDCFSLGNSYSLSLKDQVSHFSVLLTWNDLMIQWYSVVSEVCWLLNVPATG